MNPDHDPLLGRLQALSLDAPGAALSFTQRLARENGWPLAFAGLVVAEYRRFLYLAVRAGHPVTPSDAVDQAWHLHLVYTDSYWNDLCGSILGRPLHHGPTRGGREEAAKYTDWYERTLASYRRIFGEQPPARVWPRSSERFGEAPYFRRINTRRHWVIPKPAWLQRPSPRGREERLGVGDSPLRDVRVRALSASLVEELPERGRVALHVQPQPQHQRQR